LHDYYLSVSNKFIHSLEVAGTENIFLSFDGVFFSFEIISDPVRNLYQS
jgi:hypothetical protein